MGEIEGFATRLPESGQVPRAPRRHEQHVVDVYRLIALSGKDGMSSSGVVAAAGAGGRLSASNDMR